MIVRISEEGQYELPDDLHDKLNDLDDATVAAVDAGDESAFRGVLRGAADFVRDSKGTTVADDDLVVSRHHPAARRPHLRRGRRGLHRRGPGPGPGLAVGGAACHGPAARAAVGLREHPRHAGDDALRPAPLASAMGSARRGHRAAGR